MSVAYCSVTLHEEILLYASAEILPGYTEVALSPPGLTAGSSYSSYVIPGYTTLSYSEPVT